jgi:hypothetical protein
MLEVRGGRQPVIVNLVNEAAHENAQRHRQLCHGILNHKTN